MYWYVLIFYVLLIHPSESLPQNVGDVVGLGALTQNGKESVTTNLCHSTAKMSRMNMNKDILISTIWETWSFLTETCNWQGNKGLSLEGLEMPCEAPQHCMEEETCANVMMAGCMLGRTERPLMTGNEQITIWYILDHFGSFWIILVQIRMKKMLSDSG